MKKIGTAIYLHKSWLERLDLDEDIKFKIRQATSIVLNSGLFHKWTQADVFKVDFKKNTVTFIESPDWDDAREPMVGDAYNINLDTEEIKFIKNKGQIYHHKWMFVPEDYDGFDIDASKKWSEKWTSVFPKDRQIKSRIGYKRNWEMYLLIFDLR